MEGTPYGIRALGFLKKNKKNNSTRFYTFHYTQFAVELASTSLKYFPTSSQYIYPALFTICVTVCSTTRTNQQLPTMVTISQLVYAIQGMSIDIIDLSCLSCNMNAALKKNWLRQINERTPELHDWPRAAISSSLTQASLGKQLTSVIRLCFLSASEGHAPFCQCPQGPLQPKHTTVTFRPSVCNEEVEDTREELGWRWARLQKTPSLCPYRRAPQIRDKV